MYPLINSRRKFILYWNARCACTSLKNWFYFVDKNVTSDVVMINGNGVVLPSKMIHFVTPYIEEPLRISKEYRDHRSILVTRNPVDRLVSVLNHPVLESMEITNLVKDKNQRLNDLLRFLESKDMNTNVEHHLNLQCLFPDNHNMHKGPIRGIFDRILRIEDGPVIPRLNDLLGTKVPDFHENISKKDSFVPSNEQVDRIKKLYAWDYFHFYPDDSGIIDHTYYDFYPQERPAEDVPKFGDSGTSVLLLQNSMVRTGMNIKCTGEFDGQTRDAIIKWQADNDEEQTGELTGKTKWLFRG